MEAIQKIIIANNYHKLTKEEIQEAKNLIKITLRVLGVKLEIIPVFNNDSDPSLPGFTIRYDLVCYIFVLYKFLIEKKKYIHKKKPQLYSRL